jgi:hypothetical protein
VRGKREEGGQCGWKLALWLGGVLFWLVFPTSFVIIIVTIRECPDALFMTYNAMHVSSESKLRRFA